ncbi:hypothetical protein [Micromonospora sp. NPDC092111]|uniref:hypothetical protein n=1 Tax=Micromonospora sp. NPDC092111 TaxID=3364289 RepID=UPI0037F71453
MNIDKLVRAGRPTPHRDWADSAAGRQVLAKVLASPDPQPVPRARRRVRLILVGAVGLLVAGATGAAAIVAFAPEPPPSWSVPDSSVGCAEERKADSNLAIYRWNEGESPVDVCRRDWLRRTGRVPEKLFACVYRHATDAGVGTGGGVVVIPGDQYNTAAQACESIKMYVAPNDLKPNNTPPTNTPAHPGRASQGTDGGTK